jgi:hypothetical protein
VPILGPHEGTLRLGLLFIASAYFFPTGVVGRLRRAKEGAGYISSNWVRILVGAMSGPASAVSEESGPAQPITQSCWTEAATNRSRMMDKPVGVRSGVGRAPLHGESQ